MLEIQTRGYRKYYMDENNEPIYITDINGKNLWVTDDFVDISYESTNSIAASLSNLFPYNFDFRGYKVKSVEGVLQALKHKDIKEQQLIFNYAGKDAYHVRASSFNDDWREMGYLYFDGKQIDRFDIPYQNLLNELYLAVGSNPLFASTLKHTGKRELLHSIGILNPTETILTPREYIERLKIIREALITDKNPKIKLDTLSERIVEDYYEQCYTKR
jgi:hypothetical protein